MLFNLDAQQKTPLYSQLYTEIKHAIQQHTLRAGDKLPSKRELAKQHGISLNTVISAYDQLLVEGYIISKPRQGYFVADIHFQTEFEPPQPLLDMPSTTTWRYDLSRTNADPVIFPSDQFKRIYQQILTSADPMLLRSGDVQGLLTLRETLAHYLNQSRGVPCHANQIILGPSTNYLLHILLQLLPQIRCIGVEDPGYHAHISALEASGRQIIPCTLDVHGLTARATQHPAIDTLFITPNHQFPTGGIMPLERRQQFLQWAQQQSNRWLIEDDYDSEFKYSGMPIPSFAMLDQLQHVIYMGSLSRVLTPGLRMSYMVLPQHLLPHFHQIQNRFSPSLNTLTQLAIQTFMTSGHFTRHLNRSRSYYKRKRDILIESIQAIDPHAQLSGVDAGLHLLVTPSVTFDATVLQQRLAAQGIRLRTLADYSLRPQPKADQSLFISFSEVSINELPQLVNTLYRTMGVG